MKMNMNMDAIMNMNMSMKMKYEHLGWMCLAQSHGNTLKVKAYFESIKSLISSLEQKIREVYEKDRRDDLEITLENTKLLKHAAWSLLQDKDGMKMSTSSSMTKKVSRSGSGSGSRKSNGSGSRSSSRSSFVRCPGLDLSIVASYGPLIIYIQILL